MTENKNQEIFQTQDEYTAGFADEDTSVFNTGRGISREVVETISRIKGEPNWVLEYRLLKRWLFRIGDRISVT